MSILQVGSSGDAVSNLQKNLSQLGIPLDADGDFGPITEAAVKAFQGAHGLQVDGQVGPLTQAAISSALVAQIPVPPSADLPYMDWMRKNLGQSEITGGVPTAFDNDIFSHTSYGSLDGVMEEGCAATACAALEESGYLSPHSAAAISFKDYGEASDLIPGAIVVFQWASGGHHVSFVDHVIDANNVACLGGNQSSTVKISVYSRQFIVAVRSPVKAA